MRAASRCTHAGRLSSCKDSPRAPQTRRTDVSGNIGCGNPGCRELNAACGVSVYALPSPRDWTTRWVAIRALAPVRTASNAPCMDICGRPRSHRGVRLLPPLRLLSFSLGASSACTTVGWWGGTSIPPHHRRDIDWHTAPPTPLTSVRRGARAGVPRAVNAACLALPARCAYGALPG
jgi:hypothetical protein